MSAIFTWREKRLHMKMCRVPFFINTEIHTLPEGNAHYSMYSFQKRDVDSYLNLFTKKHKIYEHYSSELIIDAETKEAFEHVIGICQSNNWSYTVYLTGSGNGGAHIAVPRFAEPSEILYLKDLSLMYKFFEGVPDIDLGIYKPMHLIRGIGKTHEISKQPKVLAYSVQGETILSVNDVNINSLLLERHERSKLNIKQEIQTNWRKVQSAFNRHDPSGISHGGRHVALLCLAKDLYKCGLSYILVKSFVNEFNKEFDEPKSDEGVETAIMQAQRSILGE